MKWVELELGLQVLVREKAHAARGSNCEKRLEGRNEHSVVRLMKSLTAARKREIKIR